MAIYKFEEQKPKQNKTDYQKIVGCILVAVSIVCLFCLITHFLPVIKSFLLGVAGLFCYPFFITLLAVGFALIGHKKYIMPKKYAIYLISSIVCVLCILQLILVKNTNLSFWQYLGVSYTQKTTAGGILLGVITAPFLYILNRVGAYIIFIALSLIFIALTVDYIHYLNKNENLKNAVSVSTKPMGQKEKITVRELENNLKKSNNMFDENKPEVSKVKITLDAKQDNETSEEVAKRKLGLLDSSMQDKTDNSRYFKMENESKKEQEVSKITDTRSYILSGNTEQDFDKYRNKGIDQIQKYLAGLKSGQSQPSKNNTTNVVKTNTFVPQDALSTMPTKVIHDGDSGEPFFIPPTTNPTKSIIGQQSILSGKIQEETPEEKITPAVEIFDTSANGQFTTDENSTIDTSISKTQDNDKDNDVDTFTRKVLGELNRENKDVEEVAQYTSPSVLFKEEKEVAQPITPREPIEYVKPSIELLTTESMDLSLMSQDVVMKREELEIALDTFGIPAKVIGVVIGPAVTRYELEMPAGVSIKRLLALQEDIAYNLSSNGDIRIEAPIPGRRAVGIEVPNEKIATVGLRDIILSREFMESKANLSIALGKDISGAVKTFSLVKIPHLLIAGTTGSGKSVCINAIILSLIYRYSPDEIKFILVDPKRVEFSMYNNLPHLLTPNVITDSEKALNALAWCVDEMERRFTVFANARVKNLEEYNESGEVLEGRAEKMPYIIFIIDELADLLMTAKKEAEEHICRILQKARAAGIHMILATQRPSVDVVTGKIKANLNARICFALMTFADSKTVLDQGGADKLLGKGDMLFLSNDTGVPKRIQGCFVTTKEIDDVVTFVKENNGDYEFDLKTEQSILNPPKKDVVSQIDGDRASGDGFDVLMPQALKLIIENGNASISMIQRKFLVGYPRAARIIDQMQAAGYISPSDGGKPRSVYITMDEYNNLYGEG